MKVNIDTENKTIEIEGRYKISEIIKVLKLLLPKDWEEYELEMVKVVSYWNSPVVIEGKDYTRPLTPTWTLINKFHKDNQVLCCDVRS